MTSVYDEIYRRSPVWLQHLAVSLYGLAWRQRRYGGEFREYVNECILRENFSEEEWAAYQTVKLRELLVHAKRYVPYYMRLFAKLGLEEGDLALFTPADLPNIPILEKEQIRAQPESFIAQTPLRKKLNRYHTSGTTGTPLVIQSTTDTDRRNQAVYEARVRRWAGVNYRMSRAMIGGRMVVPQADASPPFWRYNIFERQLYFSAFHISPKNAADYAHALNRFQPDYLVGYASAHFFLARMILEKELRVHQPIAVLTSSEILTAEMRTVIQSAYRCPVFDAYSGVEACCQISECEHHTLHESPDMGIIELIDTTGRRVQDGESGEIIATGLLNFEQPLIRYRTGDLAVRTPNRCACKRQMTAYAEIIGRLEDTVVGVDGREMVRFHGIFTGLPGVRAGQVIQNTKTDFLVKLIVDSSFHEQVKDEMTRRFAERLGDVRVQYQLVERIEPTHGGKFRAVISNVRRDP